MCTPPPSSARVALVLSLGLIAGLCPASGAAMSGKGCDKTRIWTGARSSSWGEPGNWRPAGVPGPADRATFNDHRAGPCVLDCSRDVGAVSIAPGYAGATLDLGSNTLTVNESFEVADVQRLLSAAAPGCVVDMRGSGRLKNPNAANRFNALRVGATGETTTLSGSVHTCVLELGDGCLVLGPHTLYAGEGSEHADRVLVACADATVRSVGPGQIRAGTSAGKTVTMDGYNGAHASLRIAGAGTVELATRALSARTLTVWGNGTFDAAGLDVSVAAQLTIGVGAGRATFRCGSGTVTVGSLLMPAHGRGTLELDSCAFRCAGAFTVAHAGHTIVPGGSCLDFNGDKPQRVLLSGEPLGSVRVSNSRGCVTFLDQLRVEGVLSASAVSGNIRIKFDERAQHLVASFAFNGSGAHHVILRSEVEGDQVSLALGNCATVDHVDVKDNGLTGARVNATHETNRNSGNNSSNWVFATRDTDGDGIPDLIEDIVGTDPRDPHDCPLLAIPDRWVIDPDVPNIIHYDYSHIPPYASCSLVGIELPEGTYGDVLVPIIEMKEPTDPTVPPLQLPDYNELLGMVFDMTGAIRTSIAFCFPVPPGYPSWLSKEYLTLQRHDGAQWQTGGVQAFNVGRVYASLQEFSPFAISYNPDAVLCVDISVATAGNGRDWGEGNAHNNLNAALVAASSNPAVKDMFVAKGKYVPWPEMRTFHLAENVTLYGGFPERPDPVKVTGTQIHCRNPRAFPTILSGDIGVPGDNTDNCYHVVTGDNNATIDGFTMTGGYANFRDEDGKGGGIYSYQNTNFTVANCVIQDNFAGHTWAQNLGGFGGGAYFGYSSGITVRDCIFRNNTASNDRTTHGGRGGGLYMVDGTNNRVLNCLFAQNTAVWGGGITSDVGTELRIENCAFDGNRAGNGVSGPYGEWGGGYCGGSTLANCTFVNNHADAGGGAIRFSHGCEVVNGIFWNNTCAGSTLGEEVRNDANSAPVTFSYTDVQGGVNGAKFSGAPVVDGGGNKSSDPQFLDIAHGDLRLRASSPCIDAGYAGTSSPAKDFYALLRYDEPAVANTGGGTVSYYDMGAFEVTPAHFQVVTEDVGLHIAKGRRLAIADVNGDDYPDIFAIDQSEAMQYLYVFDSSTRQYADQDPDPEHPSGIRANAAGTAGRAQSGGTFVDVDNDGDLDHFSMIHWNVPGVTDRTNELLLNDGTGKFALAPERLFHLQGMMATTNGAFLDYDRDGNIDMFTSGLFAGGVAADKLSSHDHFYRGNGNGVFTDITWQTPLATTRHVSFSSTVMDYDADGYMDLLSPAYGASMYDASLGLSTPVFSHLYKNQFAASPDFPFVDATTGAGGANYEVGSPGFARYRGTGSGNASMGEYPRDFDNNGKEDLLVVIQHGTLGTMPGSHPPCAKDPGHLSVVTNEGGRFAWDESFSISPFMTHRDLDCFDNEHYGSWCDIDNDGRPDLLLSVAFNLIVMWQTSGNTFRRVSDNVGVEAFDQTGPYDYVTDVHNVLPLDYDLDGDLDILVGMFAEDRVELFENKSGNTKGNWLTVILEGKGSGFTNKSAIGSKVEVITNPPATYMRYVYAANGSLGPQEPLALHFGLGQATSIDRVRVTWQKRLPSVSDHGAAINTVVRIVEP